eukprot:8152962-Alexandrium_andersonii.AAC.1
MQPGTGSRRSPWRVTAWPRMPERQRERPTSRWRGPFVLACAQLRRSIPPWLTFRKRSGLDA